MKAIFHCCIWKSSALVPKSPFIITYCFFLKILWIISVTGIPKCHNIIFFFLRFLIQRLAMRPWTARTHFVALAGLELPWSSVPCHRSADLQLSAITRSLDFVCVTVSSVWAHTLKKHSVVDLESLLIIILKMCSLSFSLPEHSSSSTGLPASAL